MADPTEKPRTFSRIGGHVALDLVNTVQWRLSPERFEDDLAGYDHLAQWAAQTELVSRTDAEALTVVAREHPGDAEREVDGVRVLREGLYGVLFGDSNADAGTVLQEYRDAVAAGDFVPDGDQWAWTFPRDLALPRRRIALAAFDLLRSADLSMLGQCHDAECGWVYLDTSPRHNRRWCVSADCGNRNRVRDYYERNRAALTDRAK